MIDPLPLGPRESMLHSYVRTIVPAHQIADVLQETWLLAHAKGCLLTASDAWYRRVARHRAFKLFARDARRRERELRSARSVFVADGAKAPVAQIETMRVEETVASLPRDLRAIILEHYMAEKTMVEICRSSGVPIDTLKSRLRRALALLRQQLPVEYRDFAR